MTPRAQRELEPPICGARHGIAVPRGLAPPAGTGGGRFGRMFPSLAPCELDDAAIDELVACTEGKPTENPRVPSGYTYLAQFVDHDVTFDPQSSLERVNDPHALVNFRTPRFDLDSLYGSGPADQPFLYDWSCQPDPGVKLLVGHNPRDCDAPIDLPRNEQGRALIGDARNDENLIVAQLHLLFIHVHNKVVARVQRQHRGMAASEVFAEAQRIVRWHYQWIVVHDFLKRIVGDKVYTKLRPRADGTAPAAERWLSAWRGEPVMPVEFSGAAYRFGHSMVRQDYRLNSGARIVPIFRVPGDEGDHLGGFRRLPSDLVIDWDLFFFSKSSRPRLANSSSRLDTILARPLRFLPPDDAELARLNLRRSRALGLPSGPDVARAMSIEPLTDEELLTITIDEMDEASLATLRTRRSALPLWVYILLEARLRGDSGGLSLGPVGGQIVAEVLLGLLEADPNSYLRPAPPWTPELSDREDGDFTMLDLVRYVKDPDWL